MSKKTEQKTNWNPNQIYEEWKVEFIREGSDWIPRKLRMLRDNVAITESQADILNSGMNQSSVNPVMYFLKQAIPAE